MIQLISLLQDLRASAFFQGLILPQNLALILEQELPQYQTILAKAGLYALSKTKLNKLSPQPLASIFNNLKIPNQSFKAEQAYSLHPRRLSLDWDSHRADPETDLKQKLSQDLEKIAGMEAVNSQTETLLHLLHQYASRVPCDYQEDISLYDYAKIKAGLALCLEQNPNACCLVGATIPGIQSFLYDVDEAKAAQKLKGRSFYVQLILDTCLQYMLDELKISSCNIVYASGGNFYLLIPQTDKTFDQLQAIEERLSEAIFQEHRSKLGFSLAHTELSSEEISQRQLSQAWGRVATQLGQQKWQRLQKLLNKKEVFQTLFQAQEDKPQEKQSKKQKRESLYAELGKHLKDSHWFIWSRKQISNQEDLVYTCRPIPTLDYYFSLADQEEFQKLKADEYLFQAQVFNLLKINQPDFLADLGKLNHILEACSFGFTLYGGNQFPKRWRFSRRGKEAFSMTYNDLVGDGDFTRLGVLRMDVDGLGKVFIDSFNAQYETSSLARYSALSRNMDLFFKGYLNNLWERDPMFANRIQIIYAGGDDLFLVGRWAELVSLADTIQDKFKAFTGQHQLLSVSGGLSLVGTKFPILRAAKYAEEAEHLAKQHKCQIGKDKETQHKNAFSLFGQALNWKLEFPEVKAFYQRFKDKKLPKGLLMRLQTAYFEQEHYQENLKKGKATSPAWFWRLLYDLSRLEERYQKQSELKTTLAELKSFLVKKASTENGGIYYPNLKLLNLAARWAELELRSKNQT